MDSLVKLRSIKSMNQIIQLRKMYDHIKTSIRNLKGLGIEPASYGALLIPVLTEKIAQDLHMIIARKFSDKIWDLEEMLLCFKEELQAKERCTAIGLNNTDRYISIGKTDNKFTTLSFVSRRLNTESLENMSNVLSV